MPRPLVIGNGKILVCLDNHLVMRDLYYPYVGQVNHIVGRRNQAGFWMDGHFAWMDDARWERTLDYCPESLVTACVCRHAGLGLEVEVRDGVHYRENIFLRRLRVRNLAGRPRQARLFVTNDFNLDESDVGDTALWDPTLGVIYHYKRNRCFLIGGLGPEGGIAQFATGRKRFQGAEGTWRDAEDGWLECHPISQGAVDSTISFSLPLPATGHVDLHYWIVVSDGFVQARRGHELIEREGPDVLLQQTETYWRSWANSHVDRVAGLPAEMVDGYRRSLLTIRTQVDEHGAVLAANDSDILEYNRDHYSYMWPRDGALIAAALDRAGYGALTRPFFRFCARGVSEGGFLWHKYNPDGTVGSSWHPWIGPRGVQLPIQEDETALVLWALGQYHRADPNLEFIETMYAPLIRPGADFLVGYRDEKTRLPLESYDLWEERRGIFTFTTAATVAGLKAAGEIASLLGDDRNALRYRRAADQTTQALLRYLYSPALGRFLRGVYVRDGELVPDDTVESSTAGVFLLGVLPAEDERVASTMHALREHLWCRTPVGGIGRYWNDYYFRVTEDLERAPGNPWVICTLWLARWHIATARKKADLEPAFDLVRWTLRHAFSTGVLPEQIDPLNGRPLSVAPLTWSHATLVDTLLDLAAKLREVSDHAAPLSGNGKRSADPVHHLSSRHP